MNKLLTVAETLPDAPPLPLPLSAGPGADGSAPAAQPRVLPNRPSPRVPPLSSGQSRGLCQGRVTHREMLSVAAATR